MRRWLTAIHNVVSCHEDSGRLSHGTYSAFAEGRHGHAANVARNEVDVSSRRQTSPLLRSVLAMAPSVSAPGNVRALYSEG